MNKFITEKQEKLFDVRINRIKGPIRRLPTRWQTKANNDEKTQVVQPKK